MKYKLMDGKQLAEYIIGTDFDKPIDFATEYPENIKNSELESDKHRVMNWYGIKKSKVFDSNVVLVSRWGGGDCKVFDIEDTTEYLPTDLESYIKKSISDGTSVDGMVCVEFQ